MLFNSTIFVFSFLPMTLAGFYLIGGRLGLAPALAWLVLASLFFYAWWHPPFVLLILGSVAGNYLIGRWLMALYSRPQRRLVLAFGVAANLGLLATFKYAGFLAQAVNALLGAGLEVPAIILPLAISFFTFQQVAYLVDLYRGTAEPAGLLRYSLFVTFFPQLIAGPIVLQREIMPQLARADLCRPVPTNLAVGATMFTIGLAKKVIIADGVAAYADPVFAAAASGVAPGLFTAWLGTLAFGFQIYFDFSGYSDMALGLARMFNLRLPINFDSPYKATSIIDFWRRWHITLSRFLRDYLYVPLGGNRRGPARRYANVMIVMLLGGLWHGAAWTFVLWGGLHGLYIALNLAWRALRRRLTPGRDAPSRGGVIASRLATFAAVSLAWVPFRAEGLDAALAMWRGAFGLNGLSLPPEARAWLGAVAEPSTALGVRFDGVLGGLFAPAPWELWLALPAILALCWLAPNTQEILARFEPGVGAASPPRPAPLLGEHLWQPSAAWAVLVGMVAGAGLLSLNRVNEFIYFQF